MKHILFKILKPSGDLAKWLLALTVAIIISMSQLGYFKIVEQLAIKHLSFHVGSHATNPYEIFKALLILILLFWTTAIACEIVEKRVTQIKKLSMGNRALTIKLLQIAIYFAAFLVALELLGISFTTLAVFGGALGIGLGFGLQKISSNFISGLILLFERSVQQNDLVEMSDGTLGFIRKAKARYTLIETHDGKEIMVPNEDFITSQVINWTHSNKKGRIQIPIGVAYGSDLDLARKIMLDAAKNHPRCTPNPKPPQCLLRAFGDSSIDFILQLWVADITIGRWEPDSEIMLEIWRQFKANNIEIPFPQRDIHIKTHHNPIPNT